MTNRDMMITAGIIAGTTALTAVGVAVKFMRKPKSKLQKTMIRTLNTVSSVTHGLANMID